MLSKKLHPFIISPFWSFNRILIFLLKHECISNISLEKRLVPVTWKFKFLQKTQGISVTFLCLFIIFKAFVRSSNAILVYWHVKVVLRCGFLLHLVGFLKELKRFPGCFSAKKLFPICLKYQYAPLEAVQWKLRPMSDLQELSYLSVLATWLPSQDLNWVRAREAKETVFVSFRLMHAVLLCRAEPYSQLLFLPYNLSTICHNSRWSLPKVGIPIHCYRTLFQEHFKADWYKITRYLRDL